MKDLIKAQNLTINEIESIVSLANEYKLGKKSQFSEKNAAIMFFENSTRTRFSFEMALNKLCAKYYVFDNAHSSSQKGEDVYDTINNLRAIGIDTFIIRTREEDLIENLKSKKYYKPVHFINAGTGKTSHPTQALLDYFTIKEKVKSAKNKKIVIIGDIKHSRVAKSNVSILKKAGAKITLCCPKYFKEELDGTEYEENLEKALMGADIAMCLRIQRERIEETISFDDFIRKYQVNGKNLPKNTILMHPGPVNRDVEISSELLDSNTGRTILEQAENGVYTRMAILDKIFQSEVQE